MQATLAGVKMALSLGGRSLIDTTRYGEIEELGIPGGEAIRCGQRA